MDANDDVAALSGSKIGKPMTGAAELEQRKSMTIGEARERALAEIAKIFLQADVPVIGDEQTQEKSYGWVFFYQSRGYAENGDPSAMLIGNGPVVVLRRDGSVHQFGSALPAPEILRRFEIAMGFPPD
jgi:hypothetical protein